jgi:hypothetical protein
VTAVFRGRAIDPDAIVTLDFESSDHAWVSRSAVSDWLTRMAFPSMASAVREWAATEGDR